MTAGVRDAIRDDTGACEVLLRMTPGVL